MIYLRGDTHGELSCFTDEKMPGQSAWGAGDKLIITGDFGFVFYGGEGAPAEKSKLDALAKKPYEILFVDGNHENFDVLETYPEEMRYGAPVRRIRPNIFWLQRGYVYTIENKTFFVMGGGYSLDKPRRLEYRRICGQKVWFEREMPSPAEYRRASESLRQRNMSVDYILTHTAPRLIIPQIIGRAPDPHEAELNGFLDWVYYEVTFQKWFFGHLHEDAELYDLMFACHEKVHRLEE